MVNKGWVQAVCLTLIMGCNLTPRQQPLRHVDPVLPMSMTCRELTDHLNRQSQGLDAWRSINTTLTVSGAGMPGILPQHTLEGNIACQAPNRFRLTASSFVAHADLGSNDERCWFYVQPGDGNILTWRHQDSPLVEEFAVGIPRIDPEWLLVVLGVVPINPDDFELSSGPAGSSELWLTAVTDDFQGRSLRRVIKVDTSNGMAREHAIYDSNRRPLIRALLDDHRSFQGHVIPGRVTLKFPEMNSELCLKFNKIETNCHLDDTFWTIPERPNVQIVDLGNVLRSHALRVPQTQPTVVANRGFERPLHRQNVSEGSWNSEVERGASRGSIQLTNSSSDQAPDWDTPVNENQQGRISAQTQATYPEPKRRRFSFWPKWQR